jgi:pyruvate/2-oxoglutarate dehydrogenase complex dihydrolipoamide dehydrogenase (E3) component
MNQFIIIQPSDINNETLVANVHPNDWVNPEPAAMYNLVVVGAGTAGLVSAAGAAGMGAKVAIVERHLMGGDCLNVGCVPSKSLIRSARAISDVTGSDKFGIHVNGNAQIDFPAIMERMRKIRTSISPNDSARKFTSLGIDVFFGDAKFVDNGIIDVDGVPLFYKKAVIASGTQPWVPPIKGLAEAGFHTNETIFELTERPKHLLVLGTGPIGAELAQAFRRFGSEVTMIERGNNLLSREDPETVEILERAFKRDGVDIIKNATVKRITVDGDSKTAWIMVGGKEITVTVDQILVGTGRRPNVTGLNLESVGVKYDEKKGVTVNDSLRTTNPKIYAAGDVAMKYKFTHAADAAARIVLQNAFFFGRKKLSSLVMPWTTYTDPEIAHVGMYEREAIIRMINYDMFIVPMKEVDRAIADSEAEGFVKILVKKGTDKILGATIVASHAGEMLGEITLAMVANIGLGTLSGVIHAYPTQAEAIKKAADAYNKTRLTPRVKKLFEKWFTWLRR